MKVRAILLVISVSCFPAPLAAQYKSEFKMSIVVSQETSWGRAAIRFADAIKYRTQGRIKVTNYFDGRLFAGEQATEFQLLQQGTADFAIGSTINWSAQVKELNLFALPFIFPTYSAVDAVQAGEPGKRLFNLIEQKGVVPIAWGENGFREVTNSKHPIRRPEDLDGLNIRVPPMPILLETFQALGASPVSMNWGAAQTAFRQGKVDGQENPVALIIPYQIYAVQPYVTLWRYAIDPTILAVSAKTWMSLSPEDRQSMVGSIIMAEQKSEARLGLEKCDVCRGVGSSQIAEVARPARLAMTQGRPEPRGSALSDTREGQNLRSSILSQGGGKRVRGSARSITFGMRNVIPDHGGCGISAKVQQQHGG